MATRKIVKAKRKESNSNSSNNGGGGNSSSQMAQELVVEQVSQMNKEWDELISSIKKNESIPWPKLQWINSVSEAQRQQLKNEISEKTCLGVSYLFVPADSQENRVMALQIGKGEFKPNRTEQNNNTLRLFIGMLSSIGKLSFFDPSELNTFPTALLTAWAKFNGNQLDNLVAEYPPVHVMDKRIIDKKAEKIFWKAVCSQTSVRCIRVDNMPKFPTLGTRPMLTHLLSLVLTNRPADLSDLLYQLGDNIQELDIRHSFPDSIYLRDLPVLERFLESHPNFGRNLNNFTFYPIDFVQNLPLPNSQKLFEMICRRCPRLVVLSIYGLHRTPIEVFMDKVAQLRDLVELSIDPNIISLTPEVANKYEPFEHMKSVAFSSRIPLAYSVEQFRLTIPRLFPNLAKLTINATKEFKDELKEQMAELFPGIKLHWVDVMSHPDRELP